MFERITDFWRILDTKWKVLIVAGVVLGVVLVAVGPRVIYCKLTSACGGPVGPAGLNAGDLNNGVWTSDAERQQYYHTSQGSQVMPYDWFVALEQGGNDQPFIADENLARFRFIPDTNTVNNPDKLPVGFAKDDPDPVTQQVNVGLSCATCHTSRIDYKGKFVTVDGAPGRLNFDDFLAAMVGSLTVTAAAPTLLPGKFDRFAHRVLDREGGYSAEKAARLKIDVLKYIDTQLKNQAAQKKADRRQGATPTAGGYGRIDALGAGGNRLYGQLGEQNLRTLNAPVKVLPLWHTHQYNWVQTNGSIRQPMARNIIEALAVNASLVYPGNAERNDIYTSSARLKNMSWMESLIARFKAPVWPENFFGMKIDHDKAKRGEALYQQHCASCHAPRLENKPEPDDPVSGSHNQRYYVVGLWPADKIGTDPTDARNFAERTLDATAIGKSKETPGAIVIGEVLQGIIDRQYREMNIPVPQQEEMNGFRSNLLRACVAYPARPLAGIWAASPYLHNGSVPTLYQLLLPPEQRLKKFCTDTTEFDPVNVGYATSAEPCRFEFDTSLTGNSNSGHAFGTTLTDQERYDLIEFLKDLKFPEDADKVETTEPQGANWCP